MASQTVNLQKAFKTVTTVLKENRANLNQTDTYNHDHGDNMVETFDVITRAMKEKKGASPAEQLAYASELLKNKPSGSAKIYSQNLANASTRFEGKQVTKANGMELIASLLGGTQQSGGQGGGQADLLSGLLGGLAGAQEAQAPAQTQQDPLAGLLGSMMGGGGNQQSQQAQDPLTGLLGGLMGGSQGQSQSSADNNGLDIGDVLQAGMTYMQAKQQGQSTAQALIGAVLSASPLAGNAPREQSGSLIANTLMQVIGGLGKK